MIWSSVILEPPDCLERDLLLDILHYNLKSNVITREETKSRDKWRSIQRDRDKWEEGEGKENVRKKKVKRNRSVRHTIYGGGKRPQWWLSLKKKKKKIKKERAQKHK